MNKITRFTWDEWKWIVIIVMLGVNMYWTLLLIEPIHTLLTQNQFVLNETMKQTQEASVHVQTIIETMNNNTHTLQSIIENQNTLNDNQIVLIRELGNVSQDLGTKSSNIDQTSKTLVLQSASIQSLLNSLRYNLSEADKFNIQWEHDDRTRSGNIQGNISEMAKSLAFIEMVLDREDRIADAAVTNRNVNVTTG